MTMGRICASSEDSPFCVVSYLAQLLTDICNYIGQKKHNIVPGMKQLLKYLMLKEGNGERLKMTKNREAIFNPKQQ